MTKKLIAAIWSAAVLTACSGGKPQTSVADAVADSTDNSKETIADETKPQYNTTDALAFGLKGHVQTATVECYSTYESDGVLKEGNMTTTYYVTFDGLGHVTHDPWGNEYGYDADGNYYRGNHVYTTIQRDKSGRLTKYVDVEPNADNEANMTLSFKYDKNGRLEMVTQGGWTGHSTEKHTYKGNNIFPKSVETVADYEGGGTSTVSATYTYNRFDENGNWTERTCVTSETETEDDPLNDSGVSTKIQEVITVERRVITYYD